MRSIICLVLALGLVFQSSWTMSAYGQDASPPVADNSAAGLNLDLGSTDRNVAASTVLSPAASATINIGGLNRVVSAADMLTAAEFVAVRQVMHTGTQYLQLNDMGAAIGGGMRLNANLASQINSLVIPTNVHASQNAAVLQTLNLAGNFTNSGVYSILSTNSAVTSAAINASNIYNNAGALISSTLANLTLHAVNNIVNAGTIMSAGNLNLTAGGSISNMGQLAVMQAMNTMNLQAASVVNQGQIAAQLGNINALTAHVTNSGIMQSLSGSVNIRNLVGTQLAVDGILGSISAGHNINLSTLPTVKDLNGEVLSKGLISVSGNTLSGQAINLTSPEGIVNVQADRLNGPVSVSAGVAYVGAKHGNLSLSKMELTGDPIYYAQGGDLDLGGLFSGGSTFSTSGGDFIALASGDIKATGAPSNALIDTTPNLQFGSIKMYAGVDFSVTGGASPITCTDCAPLYTITGTSTSGGDINLPTVSLKTSHDLFSPQVGIHLEARDNGSQTKGNITVANITNLGIAQPSSPWPGYFNIHNTVTADGNVSLGFIDSSGVQGGDSSAVGGGYGGGVVITSSYGNVTVNGDISLMGGGSSEGSNNSNSGPGGKGGILSIVAMQGSILVDGNINTFGGGSGGGGGARLAGDGGGVTLMTNNDSITVNGAINSSGGGGGAGDGSSGGSYGGYGGNISVFTRSAITINGPVLAAGGGNGGSGGGGGSLGGGGGGGGNASVSGSGGGAFGVGGQPGAGGGGYFGGGSSGIGSGAHGGGGGGATGGNGGYTAGSQTGEDGSLGFGGNASGPGAAGQDAGTAKGGSISLSGSQVQVTETVDSAFGFSTSPFASYSVYAGGGGTVSISTPTAVLPNGDYEAGLATTPAYLGSSSFTVGGSGSSGAINAGNGIFINRTNVGTDVNSGTTAAASNSITITKNGGSAVISDGDLVTPGDWMAIVQTVHGGQQVTVDGTGNITAGTIDLGITYYPGAGFTNLVLPAGISASTDVPTVKVMGSADLGSTLDLLYTGNEGYDGWASDSLSIGVGATLNAAAALFIHPGSLLNIDGSLHAPYYIQLGEHRDLTFTGNGDISVNPAGTGIAVFVFANSSDLTATMNGSLTLNGGLSGEFYIYAPTFEIAANQTLTIGQGQTQFGIQANNVVFGANSAITIVPSNMNMLFSYVQSVTLPTGSSATVTTNGGTITFDYPFGTLHFVKSLPAGNATLNLNGGDSFINGNPVSGQGGCLICTDHTLTINSSGFLTTYNNECSIIPYQLLSLDLVNDPAAVAAIIELQTYGILGGTLIESGGVATGGNVIIAPSNLSSTLTAYNIPSNVTVTMQDFTAGYGVNIQITGSSTTSQAILAGTNEFVSTGGNSSPSLNVSSSQAGPVFVVAPSGLITSDDTITISANGDMSFSGLVSATTVNLTTFNGGSVYSSSYCGTCVILATTLNLQVTGSVGTLLNPLTTQVSNLTANVNNAAYVSNYGDLSLGLSQVGGTFQVLNSGNLSIDSYVQATDIDFRTTSGSGTITLNNSFQANNSVNLQVDGTGNIIQASGSIAAISATLSSRGDIGASGQPINVQVDEIAAHGSNVYINSSNFNLLLNSSAATDYAGNYGTFELTASGRLTVSGSASVYGGTVTLTDGFESLVDAGAVVQSFGSGNSVTWNTTTLHNNGSILGQQVSIVSNSNLAVDGSGLIGINNMPNSGVTFSGAQAIVSLVSLSGGDVTVTQGRIDGLISSSRVTQGAFSFACFCFAASFTDDGTPPTNFSVTVNQGALYGNHIKATGSLDLINTAGDIRIYGQTGWSPGTVSTSGAGNISLQTSGSYTILLDRGSIIDSSNDLDISTSYFYNNTSATFMSGNPSVHAVNTITFDNPAGFGVSGTGGMWTGTAGAEGTGAINFNATNGSIVVTSAVLMGTVNVAASATNGLFVLDVGNTSNFTAGSMAATAPSGFPAPFFATYGTTGVTYWQAPSSMNMIDPSPTQGGGLLVLSTVVPVDPSNPSGDTIDVVINGTQVTGGPTGVIFPVNCGGSCVNYTGSGMEILSTLDISGLQTGLLVVHSNMPVTVDGNATISNTGNTVFNTSTLGVLQTCNLCAGGIQPGIAINTSGGALVLGGGRGGFASQADLVTLGALSMTVSGGPFIEYGLVQGGSVVITGSATRLFSGDIQSTAGDFIINNAGQIDIFNMAATGGGASVTHTGAGYIDMNFSSIVVSGNLSGGNVSISITDNTINGGLYMRMGSDLFSNSGGDVNVVTTGTIQTNTGTKIISSGELNLTCNLCQAAPVFNNSTIASFGDLTITNTAGDLTFNATNVYTSNADVYINNLSGNLVFDLPTTVIRGDQLIFVDTVFGTFPYTPYQGGSVYVSNSGGNLTVSNGALIAGSNLIDANVSISNTGNLSLLNYGRVSAENGRAIVRNSGGDLTIGAGSGISVAGNGVSVDNYILLYNSGGAINIDTQTSEVLFSSPSFVLVMNNQDISLTGFGYSSIDTPQVTFISTNGSVQLSQHDMSGTSISGQAATNFLAAVTDGAMNVDTILANNGNIALTSSSRSNVVDGSININSGATLVANNGTVTVETCTTGTISIGANVVITALNGASAFGDVYIISGPLPSAPVTGATPANVVASQSGGGQIFFGSQSISASAPNNFVTAIGGNVVFDAAAVTDISLGGNVNINAAVAGVSPLLTSLDLQDSSTVSQIVALQSSGLIGGVLNVGGGIAIGGSADISASRLAPLLTALNLPANVSIQFLDFGTVMRPITVNLTAASTTTQATVSGSVFFSDGANSNVYVNVLSNQAGPAVLVGTTGELVSDKLLSVTANGDIAANGIVQAFDQLVIETVEAGGNIAIAADITGRDVLRVETDTAGNISQSAGTLFGNQIYLLTHGGDIGAPGSRVSLTTYDSGNNLLFAQTSGNAYLTYQGNVSLQRSFVGDSNVLDLTTTCDGSIIIDGDYVLGGSTINLTADGTGGIFETFNNQVFQADTINLTSGIGDIGGPNGPSGSDLTVGTETGTITANTGGNVYIQMNFLILCLGCPSGTSDLRPQPPSSQATTLNVGSSHATNIMHISAGNLGVNILDGAVISVAGQVDVPGDLSISAGNAVGFTPPDLTIGTGAILQVANTGAITLNANGLGNIVNNGQLITPTAGSGVLNVNASSMTGTGSISGNVVFNSGTVSVSQTSISGTVSGSSFGSDFSITVANGLLQVGSISSANNIFITNNGGDIAVIGAAIDANLGTGVITMSTAGSFGVLIETAGLSAADMVFNTGHFAGDFNIIASNSIAISNTGSVVMGLNGNLQAPTMTISSVNGSVTAWMEEALGTTINVSAQNNLLVDIRYVGGVGDATMNAVSPYAVNTITNIVGGAAQFSGGTVTYAANSAQVFFDSNLPGAALIVLNSSGTPANVTVNGSTVTSGSNIAAGSIPVCCALPVFNHGVGTIAGDFGIDNTAGGDLTIHLGEALYVTGNSTVSSNNGNMVWDGGTGYSGNALIGDGTVTIANGNSGSSVAGGNSTLNSYAAFFPNLATSTFQLSNNSGNLKFMENSFVFANGAVNVNNNGGNIQLDYQSYISGAGYIGTACSTCATTVTNSGGSIIAYGSQLETIGAGFSSNIDGYGDITSITNSGGDIILGAGGAIQSFGTTLTVGNTDGNIVVDGAWNNTGWSIINSDTAATIDVSQDGLTGNIVVSNGGSIQSVGGAVHLVTNAGHSGNILIDGPGSYISGAAGVTVEHDGTGNITVTNTGHIGLNLETIEIYTTIGNIIVSNLGSLLASSTLSVTAGTGNVILNTGAQLIADSTITITATNGNVVIDTTPFSSTGVAATPVNPSTAVSANGNVSISAGNGIVVTGYGDNSLSAVNGTINFSSAAGSVSVTQFGLTSVITGTAATTFAVTATNSSLNVGNISTNPGGLNPDGSITLIAGCVCPPAAATTLTVTANSIITARKGNVILRNADVAQGSIFLDTNSEVNARQLGSGFGNVYIVVGTIPVNPVAGLTPANVISNPTLGGQVFYGASGLTANAPDNTVNAPGTTVVFDAPGSAAITMNGNVQINSVPVITLTSLDLTDPTVTSDILALIAQGDIGGNLIVNGSGVATGGSIVITPGVLSVTITAENIPDNVTIQFQGYSASDVLAINITAASTTKQVVISGTHEYIAGVGASDGVISVTSNQAGPVFQITGTGLLISDGNLTVTTTGGDFSSAGNIIAGGTTTITSDAGVTLNNLTSAGTVAVTAQAGSITQTGFTDASFTGANGNAASITYQATTGISGVSLNATGGTVSGDGGLILVNTTGGAIAFSSFVDSSARGGGRAGDVTLTADTDITIHSVNAVGGQTPNVNARGGDILIQSNSGSLIATGTTPRFVDSSGSVFFSGTGQANAGTITVTTPGGIVGTGGAISFRAEGGHDGGNGANIIITTNGSAELDFVSSSGSTVSPTPTAAGDAGDITIIAPGGITLVDARAQGGTAGGSGGDVVLQAANGGINVTLFVFTNAVGSTGTGGLVDISGDGDIVIGNIGALSILAYGGSTIGNSSTVTVGSVNGLINISGLINTSVTTDGNAGAISLDAETGIISGGLSAAGGTTSGDGADVTATTATGDITISSFVSARAKGQGDGGDIALTATAGNVAVLGTIGTGAAIASNGGGTGSAGRIDVLYGSTTPFVIDSAGVGITNGARGNITAIATGSGDGNVVTIQNTIDDTVVTLNGTIDVTSVTGTGGFIWFVGSTGFNSTITGNASGLISGLLLGSGDNFTLTLNRPDTALLVAAINSNGLISINNSVGTSSINVPVGENISGAGGVTLTSASIVNDGLLSSIAGQVTLNNSASLSVTGAGTITGLTAAFNSTTGSVTASQGTITGTLSGTAQTSFSTTATASGLTVDAISATVNTVTLNAAGGLLSVVDSGDISAGQSVFMTGGTGVAIGNTVQITGGIVGGALNEFSLNMQDYTYAQIASPGGILITSTTGNVVTGNGVVMDAFGGSIGLTSAGDLTFGNLNDLFAQGANIWMQASDNLDIPDATITSVARYVTGSVTVDGVNMQNFTGGGIAIFAGTSLSDYNAYLKSVAVNDRVQSDTGTYVNSGATVTGGGIVMLNGAWIGLEAPAGGVLNLNNVILAADGGVISIDPPGIININGAIFGAVGPAIVPLPLPPAQQAQAQAPAAQNPFLGAALPGNGPVNLPPDGTAIQTDVSDFASPVEKNASQVMSRTAQIETVVTQSAAWVFVSGNCQPFLAQSDDSLLFGCGGTMFANNKEDGGVTMREGRLVMLTANKSLKVKTEIGDVAIPADSGGIVEQKPNGVFRLVSLSGQDAEVTLRRGDETSQILVRPGEELVVADSDMAEEELIPVDGVDRVAVAGTIKVSGLQVKKSQYDKKQMFEREQLIHCGMGSTLMSNYKRRVAKLKEEMTGESSKTISSAPPAPAGNNVMPMGVVPLNKKDKEKIGSADVYRKIGYEKSQSMEISAPGIRGVTTDYGTFKYVGSANLTFEQPGVVSLATGELLVASQKATVVRCGEHLVSVDPGAVALISNDNGFIRITNLYENSVNAVRACTAGKMISLNAGKQVMFGPTSEHVTRALGADPIARRRSMYFDLPGGKGASRCEISLVSLLQNTPVLTHLLKSTDLNDQALRERVIKMAACLAQTTSTHGPYTTVNGQH
ncbi:MAG: hypothetical protein K2Y22_08795 [Candidatus Obscuribacterales bacterium]|nr:hypothetical protein [Candidatus Obscuribacterales bacterium]